MLERLRWIAMTYLTHRAMWILVAMAALMALVDFLASTKRPVMQQMYPGPPKARRTVNSLESLELARAEGLQSKVDALDMQRLWFDMNRKKQESVDEGAKQGAVELSTPDDSFYAILSEFPNLHSLTYMDFGTNVDLKELRQLTHLESLTLNDPLNRFDLSEVAGFSGLKRLQISSFRARHDLVALAGLRELDTVIFETRSAVDDETLRQLAKLPALKTLVFNFTDTPQQPWSVAEPELVVLDRSATLRTVYVTSRSGDQAQLISAMRTVLPRFTIVPAVAPADAPFRPIFCYLPPIFLTVAVSAVLATQLRRPASRLTPHFIASHLAVGLALLALILVGSSVRLMVGGAAFLPALLVACLLQTSTLAVGAGTTLSADLQVPQRWPLVPALFVLAIFFVAIMLWRNEGLLATSNPRVLAALVLANLVFCAVSIVSFERSVRWSQGSSPASAPREPRLFEPAPQSWQSNFLLDTARREREIEALGLPRANANWYRRAQHWRLGNQPLRVVRFSIFALLIMTATQFFILSALESFRDLLWQQLPFYGAMLLALCTSQVAMLWRHRLRILSVEVLRPRPRTSLQLEWMLAFLLDLLPLAAIFAVITTVGLHVDSSFVVEWSGAAYHLVAFFFMGCAAALTVGSIIVVVQRGWLALALNYVLFMVFALGVVGMAFAYGLFQDNTHPRITFETMLTLSWFPLIGCFITTWIMARKFQRLEIGTRS